MTAIPDHRSIATMLTPLLGSVGMGVMFGLVWSDRPAAIAWASPAIVQTHVGAAAPLNPSAPDHPQRLVPPVVPLAQTDWQGNTVLLGDTSLPIPWQKRGDRIGVADIPLMRYLGVDLQDTARVGEQPVLWFSDQPQMLPTWHDNGYRYLDITDWVAARGGSLYPNRTTLQILLPSGRVQTARRGRQPWGDRIVLEVDRPVPWVLTEDVDRFTLQIQAIPLASADDLSTPLTTAAGNVLETLEVTTEKGTGNLILTGRFGATARPRVWSLTNPDRIVVDITQTDVVPRDILWAPGLRWRDEYLAVGGRAFPVHQLWLDAASSDIAMRPIWPDASRMPGTEPLITTARNAGAIAAINAGFFNRNNQLPLGAIRLNSRWFSGPILNRGAIAWGIPGRPLVSQLALTHALTTNRGETFTVAHINSGYVQAGMGLYTREWGSTYTPITDNETVVTVNQNQVVQQVATGAAGGGAYPIPATGYVLALRSFNTAARALPPGTSITLTPDPRPAVFEAFPFAVGGGPVLVRDGRVVADARGEGFSDAFAAQAAPRSAIGVMPDGRMVLVAIHFSPGGRGPTLTEAAQIMQQLGVQDALNLDGGNSASLYLGGSLINRHPATVGRVHNGIGLFLPAAEN